MPEPLGPMMATISPRANDHVDAAQGVHLQRARVVELVDGARLDDCVGRGGGQVLRALVVLVEEPSFPAPPPVCLLHEERGG